jgi:hypothetical protein
MTKDKSPRNALEMMNVLNDFLLGPEEDTRTLPLEKVKEELRNEGVDVDSFTKRALDRVSQNLSKLELREAKEKRLRLQEKLGQGKKILSDLKEDFLSRLESLKNSDPGLAQAYARKLEGADEEDLLSLIQDLDDLDELDT